MISEVALVAIVGASATVLVGLAAALAQVFGPAWRDSRMRRIDLEATRDDERFARAEQLLQSIAETKVSITGSALPFMNARARFVSTLRKGEGAVARYVAVESVYVAGRQREFFDGAQTTFAENLFGYLRGDVELRILEELTAKRKPKQKTVPAEES